MGKTNPGTHVYGRAIKDNPDDIDMMRKRISAILFHYSSSDEHPKHVHCPHCESHGVSGRELLPKGRSQGHTKTTKHCE